MFKARAAFAGLSVNDLPKAKRFYTSVLGLEVDDESMGLQLRLPGGGGSSSTPKTITSRLATRS
jgi:catechol 2,3-dioxygenase-like lactoylglutathione lyase family enzyme